MAPSHKSSSAILWAVVVLAALLLCTGVLLRPIDHDEGQYVAATALMRSGLPYRDFAYLQTPLQPLLFAPLSFLPPGWLLVGSRIVNAGLALAALLLTVLAVRPQVPRWVIPLIMVCMAFTEAFLFAGSVARNDALPFALLAGGMALLLRANGARDYAAAGLCLGMAVSAKISFLFPALGAGLFLTWQVRRIGWRPVGLAALGAAGGLLPTLWLALLAPAEFRFGVLTYGLQAPLQWYAETDRGSWLTLSGKLSRLWKFGTAGPVAVALAAVLFRLRSDDPRCRLLDFMILGGLVAAFLPTPTYPQYLIPLLPPLFARLALALPGLRRWQLGLLATFGLLTSYQGLKPSFQAAKSSLKHGPEVVEAVRQAPVVESLSHGPLATLSPERVAGRGTMIDPRFAAGPFLFRTRDGLAAQAVQWGRSVTWQRLDGLDKNPPAALLTGGERRPEVLHPQGLDGHLVAWALRHGYRPKPFGRGLVLWTAPPTEKGGPGGPPFRLTNVEKNQRE